ncbi:MAG: peptidoglycan editing factor PgeF, partial [Acidimicrobiales bacterium]
NPDHVTENRRRVAETLGTHEPHLLSAHQCHSTNVVIVDGPWQDGRPKVDGIVTKTPGIAVSALAADCAPVLFVDPVNRVIGAAHAGWRGALAGITDKTIEAMESIGANRKSMRAAIGPCIGPENFEVGPEFVDAFIADNPATKDLFRPGKNDRSLFDMKSYLVRRISAQGVQKVGALPDCTYANPDAYFSYRQNSHKGITDYGRNISAIMLNNDNV